MSTEQHRTAPEPQEGHRPWAAPTGRDRARVGDAPALPSTRARQEAREGRVQVRLERGPGQARECRSRVDAARRGVQRRPRAAVGPRGWKGLRRRRELLDGAAAVANHFGSDPLKSGRGGPRTPKYTRGQRQGPCGRLRWSGCETVAAGLVEPDHPGRRGTSVGLRTHGSESSRLPARVPQLIGSEGRKLLATK